MIKRSLMTATLVFLLGCVGAQAELLGAEWITEAEMKRQSNYARQNNLLLVSLNCRFREGVANPVRSDVTYSLRRNAETSSKQQDMNLPNRKTL